MQLNGNQNIFEPNWVTREFQGAAEPYTAASRQSHREFLERNSLSDAQIRFEREKLGCNDPFPDRPLHPANSGLYGSQPAVSNAV